MPLVRHVAGQRRQGKRAAGAGARHQLVFVDRLVATLIHLRHDPPRAVLALLFDVGRSTVTQAVGEIRALLAERGCAIAERPGLRLQILADVFAYAQAEGVELRLDATELQVRRVEVLLDDGYLCLRGDHPGQAITPLRKPNKSALADVHERWERDRHWHSSDRITVEHALADHKRWKQLTRWTHRRDVLPATYQAIAGLVSDRTATN